MHERVVVLIEVLGLLAVAAGVTAALLPLIGWAALAGAGVVLLAGAALATWQTRPRPDQPDGGESP